MTRPPIDDRDLLARLRTLRVDPDRGDFDARLRQRLVAAGPPSAPRWRWLEAWRGRRPSWAAPAMALAAILVVVAGVTLGLPRLRPAHTVVPATRVAVVRLNLSTDAPVDGAHVRVSLPPGLSFWADGEALADRAFEWTQPLSTGNNEIPIAVRGQQPGRYRIKVTARVGDQVIDDEVLLEVVKG